MLDARVSAKVWRRHGADVAAVKGIEGRATIFENAVEEVAGYVTKGLDKVQAVDQLHDMALGHGLINHWGEDRLPAHIANIFENVPVVPDDCGRAGIADEGRARRASRRFGRSRPFRDPRDDPQAPIPLCAALHPRRG